MSTEAYVKSNIRTNDARYKNKNSDLTYKFYLQNLLAIFNNKDYMEDINNNNTRLYFDLYKSELEKAIILGPQTVGTEASDLDTKLTMLVMLDFNNKIGAIDENYGLDYYYDEGGYEENGVVIPADDNQIDLGVLRKFPEYSVKVKEMKDKGLIGKGLIVGGNRRNKATSKSKAKPKHDDMTMKDIKELCKANQIKLSRVVEGKRVAYKKKELITKLKRKKLL